MAQGQKTDTETLYKVMLCWYVTKNYSEVERMTGINRKTVKLLVEKHKEDEEFTKLFQQKKEEFIETADRIINKALMLLEKRLDTALDNQNELEEALIDTYNDNELNGTEKKSIASKIQKMQINSLSEITTAIGTMYDKKLVAQNGDITSEAPRLQINIVDHSDLEGALYDETD